MIAPATGRPAPGDDPEAGGSAIAEDCDSGAPPGVRPAVEPLALFVCCPAGLLPDSLHPEQMAQAAQTRAAATAVATALAGARVPRFSMDATVAKGGGHAGGTRWRARGGRRDCSTVSARDRFWLDNR
ncbi:MAG: hypothetical protein ACJ786_25115 [Catenulispora sp.]